jgi:hypothetical protein
MESDVLADKPTIIEAIRNPDLFETHCSKLRVLGLHGLAKGRVWVGDDTERVRDQLGSQGRAIGYCS